jgi:hypothetical protein
MLCNTALVLEDAVAVCELILVNTDIALVFVTIRRRRMRWLIGMAKQQETALVT